MRGAPYLRSRADWRAELLDERSQWPRGTTRGRVQEREQRPESLVRDQPPRTSSSAGGQQHGAGHGAGRHDVSRGRGGRSSHLRHRLRRNHSCWGQDLGDGAPDSSRHLLLEYFGWNEPHTCGLDGSGNIYCWGSNDYGESLHRAEPTRPISVGGNHSCALDTVGNAICWGRSDSLQTIVPTSRYTAIAAGRAHTCGINLQQKVVCWGDNSAGQSMPPVTGTGVPVDTGISDTGWGW